MQDGKSLIREGKWKDAKEKFDLVAETAPNYPSLQDLLDRTAKEIPNQEHLEKAAAALKKNQIATTAAELKAVSADTQQDQALRELSRALDDKVYARINEARARIGAGVPYSEGPLL